MPRIASLRGLSAAIRPAGGTHDVERVGDGYTGSILSPAGRVWRATDAHSIAVDWWGPWADGADTIERALADVAEGTRPCDDPECGECHP